MKLKKSNKEKGNYPVLDYKACTSGKFDSIKIQLIYIVLYMQLRQLLAVDRANKLY